jgi:hypothetical protein
MKLQPPRVDFLPGHTAVADGEKAVAVLFHADHDDAVTQKGDAREQEANQVHDVLPTDLAPSPEVLFQLLELSDHVAVVRLIDELRQERLAHAEELVRQRRRVLDQGCPEALEDVGVRL